MEEINIKSYGINITEDMRKHIVQRLNSVFGFNKSQVQKIVIKLYEKDKQIDENDISCHIKIYIKNNRPITTKLKSLDIFSAITLAIERAKLKLDHQIIGENNKNKRILINKKSLRYGSYRIYQ